MDVSLSELREMVMDREAWRASIHGVLKARILKWFSIPFKKQQVELDMEQQTGSKQEKEYVKAVYCHPAYLTSMQSTL